MPFFAVQVVTPTIDNLPENYATNVWHTEATDFTSLALFMGAVQAFYEDITLVHSQWVRQNGHEIKAYNLADPIPRAPVITNTFDLPSQPTAGTEPTEISCCLSFQAVAESGVPQSRRRGRIYIPFFGVGTGNNDGYIDSGTVGVIVGAAQALLTLSNAATDWYWATYSPTIVQQGGTLGDAMRPVDNGWVDNEWDVQRRRGRIATARTTF